MSLSLGGNNDVITELFLPRKSLVSYIPAGDGKLVNLFLRCKEAVNITPKEVVGAFSTRAKMIKAALSRIFRISERHYYKHIF
jgi:hypothetical protein